MKGKLTFTPKNGGLIMFGTPDIFMVGLPFISLVGWLIYFVKKKYSAILGFSILLVILDMQHILILFREYEVFTAQSTLHSYILWAGVCCFVLGVFGIIYSAAAMRNNTND